jgi:hypothetical protein
MNTPRPLPHVPTHPKLRPTEHQRSCEHAFEAVRAGRITVKQCRRCGMLEHSR